MNYSALSEHCPSKKSFNI